MNENKNPRIKIYFLSRSHLPSRTAHVVDLEAHQRNGVTLMLMIIRLFIIIFIIIGVAGGGVGALVNFKTSSKFPIVLESHVNVKCEFLYGFQDSRSLAMSSAVDQLVVRERRKTVVAREAESSLLRWIEGQYVSVLSGTIYFWFR